MHIEQTALPGVCLLYAVKHGDERGFLSETCKLSTLQHAGIETIWRQENHSYSARAGVVRGLHFQRPPCAQAKLVRVVRGAIFDVALDLRRDSPTYGRHLGVEISAQNWTQIYLPEGIAHGFCTLSDDTEVIYKMSAEYAPEFEAGVLWNDPALAIEWPVEASRALVSGRDKYWPPLRELASVF